MDIGNSFDRGQIVMSTVPSAKQVAPKVRDNTILLPSILDITNGFKEMKDKDTGPSCSLAESLSKQDLFINSTLAQHAATLLWKLFRDPYLQHHGYYVNAATSHVTPMKIALNHKD